MITISLNTPNQPQYEKFFQNPMLGEMLNEIFGKTPIHTNACS